MNNINDLQVNQVLNRLHKEASAQGFTLLKNLAKTEFIGLPIPA